MTYSTLLFDLDGTISDPLVGIARSFNYALRSFGYEERPECDLASYIGPPIDATFAELTGNDSTSRIADLISKYRERFSEVGYSENVLYPGIPEALEALHADGAVLAICTSKRADYAKKIVEMFGLEHLFAFIDGGDVGVHKRQQIEQLIEGGRISSDSLMIGDRDVDIQAARCNGIESAAVLWGYGSHAELAGAEPNHIFSSPRDLLQLRG